MKADIVEICMTPVNAIKDTLKEIGAVCRNCDHYWKGLCMMTEYEVGDPDNAMCMDFKFRDEQACATFWKKICEEYEKNQDESSENVR